ncbi:hypothetical protein [Vibrio phage vB_VpM-pA2SJ1]|uniref:Uncharacterized protein n=1 Tax=Vibrio phage vB_VpM-pA2SJ1 TaxID=3095964 RepID=A0AAX4J584_9CAUD
MNSMKIEISFEDLISDIFETSESDEYGFSPTMDFKTALRESIIYQVKKEMMSNIKAEALEDMRKQGQQQVQEFINGELKGIIHRKMLSGEFRSTRGGFKSFDEVIEKHLSSMNVESVIKRHIDTKAEQFAKDMRARYDNIFAAKVVQSLNNQKMLSDDVAKILLGDVE